MSSVSDDIDTQTTQEKLHVFDIHTDRNLFPPQGSLPRISDEIRNFLEEQEENIDQFIKTPCLLPIDVDDSLPITDYLISSSHNTYLLARQVLGRASATCYTHVLNSGCRCVEIDVWPSSKGPIVTHGHTLSSSVPFKDVCSAINDALAPLPTNYDPSYNPNNLNYWPVLVSLECHVSSSTGQQELVSIMTDTWGEKLVVGPLPGVEDGDVRPRDLWGRVLVMVEYYPPTPVRNAVNRLGGIDQEEEEEEESESESEIFEEENHEAGNKISRVWPHRRQSEGKKEKVKITPELAELGYYARSMKPKKGWFDQIFTDPAHILINISESALSRLITASSSTSKTPEKPHNIFHSLLVHASTHLRRIYPRGTRLFSSNPIPYKFWNNGSQIVSVNWQKWDLGRQVGEGYFIGGYGWRPKPSKMQRKVVLEGERGKTSGTGKKVNVRMQIAGVCGIPAPNGKYGKSFKTYVKAELLNVPGKGDLSWKTKALKVEHVPGKGADAFWGQDELWEVGFECEDDEDLGFVFVRFLIKEQELGKDDELVLFCSPLDRFVTDQWVGVRMFGAKGLKDESSKDKSQDVEEWEKKEKIPLEGKDVGSYLVGRVGVEWVET